jgi:hypothetical protein
MAEPKDWKSWMPEPKGWKSWLPESQGWRSWMSQKTLPNQGVISGIGSLPGASILQPALTATPQTPINQVNSSCL